jgi:hypothetical protein
LDKPSEAEIRLPDRDRAEEVRHFLLGHLVEGLADNRFQGLLRHLALGDGVQDLDQVERRQKREELLLAEIDPLGLDLRDVRRLRLDGRDRGRRLWFGLLLNLRQVDHDLAQIVQRRVPPRLVEVRQGCRLLHGERQVLGDPADDGLLAHFGVAVHQVGLIACAAVADRVHLGLRHHVEVMTAVLELGVGVKVSDLAAVAAGRDVLQPLVQAVGVVEVIVAVNRLRVDRGD